MAAWSIEQTEFNCPPFHIACKRHYPPIRPRTPTPAARYLTPAESPPFGLGIIAADSFLHLPRRLGLLRRLLDDISTPTRCSDHGAHTVRW